MVVHRYSGAEHRDGAPLPETRVVETILSRYRNLIVLAMVVVSQLLLLAWQVKTNQDVPLIRIWAVTAVTPMAGVIEAVRRNTIGFLEDYFILLDVREQNRKLRQENNRLKMDNVYYRNQMQTADRARVLSAFQIQTPSRTVAARIIGNSTASSAQAVFLDRGSTSGIQSGMAVVTPDGIVGKVVAAYPLASQVLLVTDATFAVGVESQKGHIHGTLHCNGASCTVDYVQNEEKVDKGEWFFTSGEDRIFPKGFPVGTVSAEKSGPFMKEVHLSLSGSPGANDEVLVILEGVHQQIPSKPPEQHFAKSLPPPPEDSPADQQAPKLSTEADSIKQKYSELGKQQNHEFGAIGSNLPNFNARPADPAGGQTQAQSAAAQAPGNPKPPAAQTPSKPIPGPSGPSAARSVGPAVLGARPSTAPRSAPQPPPSGAPALPAHNGLTLPLGSPRKNAAPPPGATPPGATPPGAARQ